MSTLTFLEAFPQDLTAGMWVQSSTGIDFQCAGLPWLVTVETVAVPVDSSLTPVLYFDRGRKIRATPPMGIRR